MGAAIGLAPLLGLPTPVLVLICGSVAFGLLASGSYRLLERVLMGAVAVMGAGFVAAAGLALTQRGVSWTDLRPVWPAADYRLVLALIGTTMVPYNLFLHASAASERWAKVRPRSRGLTLSRLDSSIGIALGGVVTLAILMATALTMEGRPLTTAAEAMQGLEAVLGASGARVTFSLGLAAAGLSSAITAPLAAAYAISGLFGWSTDKSSRSFRAIWSAVLLTGLVLAMWFGSSPTETIIAAQAANAVVLPVIAIVLWMACNHPSLGQYANGRGRNLAVALVIVMIVLLTFGRWWF
jgi:manganese transport protein